MISTKDITVFTHSSIGIKTPVGNVYCDPFKMEEERHDADFILITHDHFDHFSPEDIRKVAKEGSVLIVPEAMEKKAREVADLVSRIETVAPGKVYEIADGLTIETVPAYNPAKHFHPKAAGWVGYILCVDGQRIYIAGDTDITEANRKVRCDIALVPIGGTYTMDAREAAQLVNEIRPRVVIPDHYGSVAGKKNDAKEFQALVDPAIQVEIQI